MSILGLSASLMKLIMACHGDNCSISLSMILVVAVVVVVAVVAAPVLLVSVALVLSRLPLLLLSSPVVRQAIPLLLLLRVSPLLVQLSLLSCSLFSFLVFALQ